MYVVFVSVLTETTSINLFHDISDRRRSRSSAPLYGIILERRTQVGGLRRFVLYRVGC